MTHPQALELLNKHLTNKNLIKHSLAVEAGMKGLAKHFGESQEDWAMAGLLHDIDYDLVVPDKLSEHSKLGAQLLKEAGLSENIYQVCYHLALYLLDIFVVLRILYLVAYYFRLNFKQKLDHSLDLWSFIFLFSAGIW